VIEKEMDQIEGALKGSTTVGQVKGWLTDNVEVELGFQQRLLIWIPRWGGLFHH